MELNINKLSQTEQEAEIKLTWDELAPYFEEAYKKFQAEAEIKGFRKGKAPLELIKRQFGEQIEYDALDDIVNDVYQNLVRDKKIEVIGTPELVDVDYKRGESLTFKIKYEILPEVEISNYSNLQVEKIVHTVDDKVKPPTSKWFTTTPTEALAECAETAEDASQNLHIC